MNSYLNEPLRASFTLKNIDADSLGDIILSLADQDTYQSMGLIRPYFLSKLTFKITAGKDASHIVHIATRQRIREPILDILVKVSEKQSSLTRLYTLMLDPREMVDVTTNKASVVINKPVKKEKAKVIQTQQEKVSSGNIRVGNDSISIIAQNSPLHEKYSVYQIMRAFYLINTAEFLQGNINNLKSGSLLIVPDETMVAEVSRQKSINFVYAASKNNPFKNKTVAQQNKKTAVQQVKAKPVIKQRKDAAPLTSSHDKKLQNIAVQQLGQSMLEDVKSWRSVSDEFKSLSSVVQSQNKAIRVQSSVLQVINDQLEQKDRQIELVNLRLQALEGDRLPGEIESQVMLPENRDILTKQNDQLLQQEGSISSINEILSKRVAEINRIKVRLDELEQLERKLTDNPSPAPVVPELPVINLQPDTEVILENSKISSLFWGLLVLALLFIVIRERIWRGRLKLISVSPLSQKQDMAMEITDDLKAADNVLIDEEHQVEDIKPDIQPVPVESNFKLADKKFQDAVAHAREFKLDPATPYHAGSIQEINAETLYSEIDILIAYQLYEEAFELIETARDTLEENGCLDIRELEILAYTKNVDIFFPKYEQVKQQLADEFPEAWEKIENLHGQLTSEFHMIATL